MTLANPQCDDTIEVRNPASGDIVGRVPDENAAAVVMKAQTLRDAQPEWEELGPSGRERWLRRWQEWLLDNSGYLADVLQSETGKPRADAVLEVPVAADLINYYGRRCGEFLADRNPKPHSFLGFSKRLTTVYRPYPLIGIITPWNFPLAMPALDVIPALAAGAAVLLKPSEVTPLSGVEFARGWTEVGAPPVLGVVTGGGGTGAAVVDTVDFVQFTGSTRTGRRIAKACGERLIPCSLELGGKDPALVLSDADIDRAARGIAFGGLLNAGQLCISVERVYVEEAVYDEFVQRITEHIATLRQGEDDRSYAYDIGPLANENQCGIVVRHVDEALAAGAQTTTGGRATGHGTYFEPTVLTGVDHSMSCIREETFGPILPIIKVADAAEAVALANDSPYGLSATVWTRDRKRGEHIARRLEVGAVNINDFGSNLFNFALPMGGWKESGIGTRFGGANGVRKYCRQQAITAARFPVARKEILWFPHSRVKFGVLVAAMRAATARGRGRLGMSPKNRSSGL